MSRDDGRRVARQRKVTGARDMIEGSDFSDAVTSHVTPGGRRAGAVYFPEGVTKPQRAFPVESRTRTQSSVPSPRRPGVVNVRRPVFAYS